MRKTRGEEESQEEAGCYYLTRGTGDRTTRQGRAALRRAAPCRVDTGIVCVPRRVGSAVGHAGTGASGSWEGEGDRRPGSRASRKLAEA